MAEPPSSYHPTQRLTVPASGFVVPADLVPLADRYEFLCQMGQGGMGRVYQARDRETGDIVALKVLHPQVAADPAMAERFKNELRLARRITHKNVCRIFDFNRIDSMAYITMECVDGETLRESIDRTGTLSVARAISIVLQVCAGLQEAHAEGIVHRDLKPENVMITPAGQVKLMDFGIARSLVAGTSTAHTMIGTPLYMAPEQARGGRVDARTDIYALGLILYECVTGRRAFTGTTPVDVALKQIQERPPAPRSLNADVPRALEAAVLRCLEKEPAQRFASADALAAALKCVSGPSADAVPAGAPRRWPLWLGIGVLLVLVGVIAAKRAVVPRTLPAPVAAVKVPPAKKAATVHTETAAKPVDRRAEFKALQVAAEAGNADAQFKLAQALFGGPVAIRNEAKAAEWMQRAAEQGHVNAQFALGFMYEKGRGVARDRAKSIVWYQRAADGGHERARDVLERRVVRERRR